MISDLRATASCLLLAALAAVSSAQAQTQGGVVRGNTEINAAVGGQTTIAAGSNNKAESNVGVVKGNVRGNTEINAAVGSMTTIAAGSGNTAKTNVGVVKDRSNAKVTVGVGNVTNVVAGRGQKGCINIGTKGVDDCK
jgi:hypothetical protein